MIRPSSAWPAAVTRCAGVVGDPVRHSLSPLLHNAAYAALGLDFVYVAFPVATGEMAAAIAGGKALGLSGLSVTTPHKQAAADRADQVSSVVERLGAANTLVFRSNLALAESTDGIGLLDDLRVGLALEVEGRRVAVLGAGGAARAAILAVADAGAAEVIVVNRTPARAAAAAALAGARGRPGRIEEVADAALVIQATPAELGGYAGGGGSLIEQVGARLSAGQIAYDLVYHPAVTPFLARAGEKGAKVRNGIGMLVHQAAHQFRLFTGEAAPLAAMWAALARAGIAD